MNKADQILDEIDAGVVYPTGRAVARALCAKIQFSDELCQRAVAITGAPEASEEASEMREALWSRIGETPLEEQAELRLAVSCFAADKQVDGSDAEYLIDWALDVGLSHHEIIKAFHSVRR